MERFQRLRDPVLLPPRSHFYPFLPCAVEGVDVECLTSYIGRLAWAYRVPAGTFAFLLADRLRPTAPRTRFEQTFPWFKVTFTRAQMMEINGGSPAMLPWVEELQTLTGQALLQALTIHRWAHPLNDADFFRRGIAWCPDCYNEWRERKQAIYQKLIWMMAHATTCIIHHCHLVELCPTCHRRQHVLPIKMTPHGYCMACHAWLGDRCGEPCQNQSELHWNVWFHQTVGELMHLPREALQWDTVIHNLTRITTHLGGMESVAQLLKVPKILLQRGLDMGMGPPSLAQALYLSYAFGDTLQELRERDIASKVSLERSRQGSQVTYPWIENLADLKHVKVQVGQFLRDCLEGKQYWVSGSHLARACWIGVLTLRNWYPTEVAELRMRRNRLFNQGEQQAMVRQEVRKLLQTPQAEKRLLNRTSATSSVAYPFPLFHPKLSRTMYHQDEDAP